MLADALAELKKRGKDRNVCVVENWSRTLKSEEKDLFDACVEDLNISARELYFTLGKVPFGKTSLTDHRAGRCSCRN